jgi:hypothetical protein
MTGAAVQFAPDMSLVFYEAFDTNKTLLWEKRKWALEDLETSYDVWDVDILSLSWGTEDPDNNQYLSESVKDDIDNAIDSLFQGGVAIFIASGNEDNSFVSWPATHASNNSGIMSVGAVYDSGVYKSDRWVFSENVEGSNYGDGLELMAPGVYVKTTDTDYTWTDTLYGTSFAAPIAAGISACLIEQFNSVPSGQRPSITSSFIEERLRETAEIPSGKSATEYGDGIIRAAASMLNWKDYINQDSTSTYGTISGFPNLQAGSGLANFTEELVVYDYTHWYEDFQSTTFPPTDWSTDEWERISSGGQSGAYAKCEDDGGYLISPDYDMSDASQVLVEFYWSGACDGDLSVYAYDKWGNYDLIGTYYLSRGWESVSWSSTSSQYQHANFKVKYDATLYWMNNWFAVDTHHVRRRVTLNDYRFNHTLRFTGLDSNVYANATLCLNITEHSGSENLVVECRYGIQWIELSSTVSSGNYSFDVGSYISGSELDIRIYGATESPDSSQDIWTFSYLYLRVLDASISYYSS